MTEDDLDERVDALDRFERTIDAQIALLNEIDQKASNVVRYTSVLVGAMFTGLSLLSRTGLTSFAPVGPLPRLSFLLGITAFVVAICTAMITYLSSVQEYGADPSYGYTVADGDVRSPHYERAMLAGYADAVRRNVDVIDANARRFGWSIAGLFAGVVYSALAGGLLLLDAPFRMELACFGVATAVVTLVVYKIHAEDFLVIERR